MRTTGSPAACPDEQGDGEGERVARHGSHDVACSPPIVIWSPGLNPAAFATGKERRALGGARRPDGRRQRRRRRRGDARRRSSSSRSTASSCPRGRSARRCACRRGTGTTALPAAGAGATTSVVGEDEEVELVEDDEVVGDAAAGLAGAAVVGAASPADFAHRDGVERVVVRVAGRLGPVRMYCERALGQGHRSTPASPADRAGEASTPGCRRPRPCTRCSGTACP